MTDQTTAGLDTADMDTADMDTAAVDAATGVPAYPFPRPSALDPSPDYARLRATCPVASVTMPSGDQGYLVTTYDDVRTVLSGGQRLDLLPPVSDTVPRPAESAQVRP